MPLDIEKDTGRVSPDTEFMLGSDTVLNYENRHSKRTSGRRKAVMGMEVRKVKTIASKRTKTP